MALLHTCLLARTIVAALISPTHLRFLQPFFLAMIGSLAIGAWSANPLRNLHSFYAILATVSSQSLREFCDLSTMNFNPLLRIEISAWVRIAISVVPDNPPREIGSSAIGHFEDSGNVVISPAYFFDPRRGRDGVPSFHRSVSRPPEVSVYLPQVGRYFDASRFPNVTLLRVAYSGKCTRLEAWRARWIHLAIDHSPDSESIGS